MPGKVSDIHLDHLNKLTKEQPEKIYGLQWGDPDELAFLKTVRELAIDPFIMPETSVVEIGPGGGRWTRYMTDAKRIYAVDPFDEILKLHRENFQEYKNVVHILNSGTDFPGIDAGSIDYIFSFGVFVHLDISVIEEYLDSMKTILKPEGRVFINYADKTKPVAFRNGGFAVNHPDMMRRLIAQKGYTILWENMSLLPNSNLVLFRAAREGEKFWPTGEVPPLPSNLYNVRR